MASSPCGVTFVPSATDSNWMLTLADATLVASLSYEIFFLIAYSAAQGFPTAAQ